jgi:outer membrane protein insertion porin family
VLSCVVMLSSLPAAQTRKPAKPLPPSAFKLIAIKVTGNNRYTPEEIIGASGLQVGQTAHEEDFKKASQQLGETGAFTNVAYAFQFSSEGTKVDLQITENDKFVPARFDNFVWLSDKELIEQLHTRVPLFRGQLPVAGNLPDTVSDALQALVIERKINGRADYLRSGPEDGPIEAIDYTIVGPTVHMGNVEFAGGDADPMSQLQAASAKLRGQVYSRIKLRAQEEKEMLPVYLGRGYLKASFADPQPKIVKENPDEVVVDITFAVNQGRQYKVTEIQLSGNKAFSAKKLRELVHQKAGEAANAIQLEHDLDVIKKLYGTRGYMEASVRSVPEFDDAEGSIRYRLEIREGELYKMGELEIQGLDNRTTARLVEAWKIRGGDPYDSSYPARFREETKDLLPSGEWNVSLHEGLDEKDRVVDVTLRFDPKLSR